MFALNLLIVAGITSMLDGVPFWRTIWGALGTLLGSIAINVALALAATGLCLELGLGGTAFAAFTLIAFSYMARLVSTARHRSKQYASLSWGVLSACCARSTSATRARRAMPPPSRRSRATSRDEAGM